MLTLADGSAERFAVRPTNPLSPAPGPVVARLTAGKSARVVSTTSDFLGQPAYLISGYSTQPLLFVALNVPITQKSARAQVSVTGSTQNPFLVNEQIIDPNSINAPRPEPQSVKLIFNGPQRLVPPAPPTPVHEVHHVYYNPADASGRAGKTLPFTTPLGAGISGYVLQRAPVRSLAIADIKRRIALANVADNNPVVIDGGTPRPDLVPWIASLPQWLSAYNAINSTAWTIANVLDDTAAQRAFIEHFYGGLLDDELRALGDLGGNATGYARVNPKPSEPGGSISDTVDGTGYGRTLYRLSAVNAAGSLSSTTGSIGPYYIQIVTPPRPPVLYKLQATESAIVVAWALDTNPDVAAYLVYRAATLDALADLRYFGVDWTHPAPASALPSVRYNEQSYPPLSFVQGTSPNIDQRIIALVPDPRLCARDYNGSDMGEIALPPGPPPDSVNGVYRLSDYSSARAPLSQLAFNYWTPPASGGIAQLKTDSPTQSRLTGLRIGLGRGVPVVVVATWKGSVKVVGQVAVRRAGFVDGVANGGAPLDPNAIPAAFSAQHQRSQRLRCRCRRHLRQSLRSIEGFRRADAGQGFRLLTQFKPFQEGRRNATRRSHCSGSRRFVGSSHAQSRSSHDCALSTAQHLGGPNCERWHPLHAHPDTAWRTFRRVERHDHRRQRHQHCADRRGKGCHHYRRQSGLGG